MGRPTNEWGFDMNLTEIAFLSISSGTGESHHDSFANRLVDVGDVNGDGVNDI